MKWIKLLVSGGLLAALAWRTDWQQVMAAFAHLHLGLWLLAFALYLVTQVVGALRWQMLARPLGFNQPLGHYVGFYFIGMFFNLFLPTAVGGDVVRAWYLADRRNRRVDAFLSVLVDRGSGFVVLLALAVVALLACPVNLPSWISWTVWSAAASAGLGLAIFALFCRSVRNALGATGIKLTAWKIHWTWLNRRRLLRQTTYLSIVVQAANVVLVWLVALALDMQVPAVYLAVAVPMVTLLTLLPSINGMGVREGGMVLFLHPLGVAPETAMTLSFLWFAVFSSASLLGGAIYLFGRFPRPEEQAEHGPLGHHSYQGRAGQLGAAA